NKASRRDSRCSWPITFVICNDWEVDFNHCCVSCFQQGSSTFPFFHHRLTRCDPLAHGSAKTLQLMVIWPSASNIIRIDVHLRNTKTQSGKRRWSPVF